MQEEEKNKEEENKKVVIYIHGLREPDPFHAVIDSFKRIRPLSQIDINAPGKFGFYSFSQGSPYLSTTHTFYWDRYNKDQTGGILSKKARYEAAQYLFKMLTTDDYKEKEISIIAHSHGVNVATELLRVIAGTKSSLKIRNLIFYETPKGCLTEEGIHSKVNEAYVAENVYDINLDYKPNHKLQQQQKVIQVIDIFHQFPRCFRTFLKKRKALQDILLNGKNLNHNSLDAINNLIKDLLANTINETYCTDYRAEKKDNFHAHHIGFQYFCYYILPYISRAIKGIIIYKLLMRYDKKYNLRIRQRLFNIKYLKYLYHIS